jgi:hypothetical protein
MATATGIGLGLQYQHIAVPPLPVRYAPLAYVEYDDIPFFADTQTSSGLFVSERNAGSIGGTFSSAGAARPVVANAIGGGDVRRVGAFGSTQYQDHSGAAALWSTLTGPSTLAVTARSDLSGTQTICGTADSSNVANVGVELFVDATGAITWRVSDGVGWILDVTTAAASVAANTTVRITCTLSASAYAIHVDGVSVDSGAPSRTPTILTPSAAMRIGARIGGTQVLVGNVMMFFACVNALSTEQREALESYEATRYSQIYALTKGATWFHYPRFGGVTDPANPTASYAAIPDLSGKGHGLTVYGGTQAKEPAVAATPDGNAAAEYKGGQAMTVAAGVGYGAEDCFTLHTLVNFDDYAAGTSEALVDAQTGRVIAGLSSTAGKLGWYDGGGSWVGLADCPSGWGLFSVYLDGVTGVGRLYWNGVQISQDTYTPTTLGGAIVCGAAYGGGSNYFDGKIAIDHLRSGAAAIDGTTVYTDLDEILQLEPAYGGHATLTKQLSCIGALAEVDPSDAANFVLDGTNVIVAYDTSKDFDESVSDGDFATGTPWTAGTHWSIGAGVATAASALAAEYLEQGCITANRGLLTYTATVSANSVTPYGGTVAGTAQTAGGTFYDVIDSDGTDLKFGGHAAGFDGTIDDVSWKRGNHAWQPNAADRPVLNAAGEYLTTDGTSQHLKGFPTDPSMGTVAMWVWFISLSTSKYIFGSRDGSSQFFALLASSTVLRFYCGTSLQYVEHSVSGPPTGQWLKLFATYNGTALSISLDGVKVSNSSGGTPSNIASYLAARNNSGTDDLHMPLRVGSVKLWNRVVADAELTDWFTSHKPPGAP